jgi:methionine-gamma-lyase
MSDEGYRKTTIGKRVLKPATQMVSYGYDPAMSEGAVKPPVFLTSTFAFPSAEAGAAHFDLNAGRRQAQGDEKPGLIYSRFNHPNLEIVEDRLALLDGSAAAAVTASGMAAISTTLLALLKPGDVIIQSDPLYGGTENLLHGILAEWGLQTVTLPIPLTRENLAATLDKAVALGNPAMIYIETPANPTNAMVDFDLIATGLTERYANPAERPVTVCDNTLLGPIFLKPVLHGIDLCVYSLTKYVGGHSDLVAGGITGEASLITRVRKTRSVLGTQLDPHSSWMISRSMETLILRMERAAASASKIAAWLAGNPHVGCLVLHPEHDLDAGSKALFARYSSSFGSTFSFVVDGGRAQAFAILNALRLFKLAVSLGGTESLVCHPASTTHSGVAAELRDAAGVTEGLIRVSIGIEDADDLIADLERAFAHAATR